MNPRSAVDRVRAANPVRHDNLDANTAAAEQLLQRIMASPRGEPLPAVRGQLAPGKRVRAPLAAAAGVVALAAAATIVVQSIPERPMQIGPGQSNLPMVPPLSIGPLDPAQAIEDLDRCWAVADASQRAAEFEPRQTWLPAFAVERNGHRVTAYKERGLHPRFCDTTATTATANAPVSEVREILGGGPKPGQPGIYYIGLYLSPSGVFGGVAHGGVAEVRFEINGSRQAMATIRDDMFVVDLGALSEDDEITATASAANSELVWHGTIRNERTRTDLVAIIGVDRP